ncbi:hypothetical protein [Acinetobacter modestus]|uniref:hypothetical protein n=1 Tax=Acinetobacter modestus TaxID=1776740 RepID=UPI001F4B3056|nr:hypothetical protein [Acinetobacter modestus]MCH7333839.1 hypothetical protein [Acinetobacter modestus]
MAYLYILESLLKRHLENSSFQDGNSLLECDFLDTYSNDIVGWLNSNQLDVFSMNQWDVAEKNYISKVINEHGKYVDPYKKWENVPIFYLKKYSYGINYLTPISYKFYIQSLMWNYVKNRDIFIKEINSLEPWLYSLYPLNEDFSVDDGKFNKFTDIGLIEGRLISYFLFCIYHDSLIPEEIRCLAKDINSLFWISWKYML